MKILIICGSYPPIKCGVGDYTFGLANALVKISGIEIGILTSCDAQLVTYNNGSPQIFPVIPEWKMENLRKIIQVIYSYRPDIIHIQYPALGYTVILMRLLPLLLAFKKIPIVQTWHEHLNECSMVGWINLLACKALIYVRNDFIASLPAWVNIFFKKIPKFFIPNASVIPPVFLSEIQILNLKNTLSPSKKIVCFFGFVNPNKGVDQLFEIIDPKKFHLLLICDLDPLNHYQKIIIEHAKDKLWVNNVTITGYLSDKKIGEFFLAADAVIFPFPEGAGDWNSSLKAAQASGVFTLATTKNQSLIGYNEVSNTYYVPCNDIGLMASIVEEYAGRRIAPNLTDDWQEIALKHYSVYRQVLEDSLS